MIYMFLLDEECMVFKEQKPSQQKVIIFDEV